MKIPFNLEYQIDKSLREVPIEAAEFRKGIEFLKTEIAHLKGIEKARACSKLGSLQRIQGELVESLHSLHLAGTLLKTFSNPRLSIINSLRLAQTFQFQGELYRSQHGILCFEKAFESDSSNSDLHDFVFQHRGKYYFDQGNFELAKEYFLKALALRKEKGNSELINSTEFALEVTSKLLTN